MRPLPELVAALPEPLRRFELEQGLEIRARRMFAPLAQELEARLRVVEGMLG